MQELQVAGAYNRKGEVMLTLTHKGTGEPLMIHAEDIKSVIPQTGGGCLLVTGRGGHGPQGPCVEDGSSTVITQIGLALNEQEEKP